MFDIFGSVSGEQFEQANQKHLANHVAVTRLLVIKGLITDEELSAAMQAAEKEVALVFARARAEVLQEYDQEHPDVREMIKKVLGGKSQVDEQ